MDLVFIDGGHTLELVQNDTKAAKQMVAKYGVIAWHDYLNPNYSAEFSAFIEQEAQIFVEETGLAFHFQDENVLSLLHANIRPDLGLLAYRRPARPVE